jgi:hypothetical protein
MARQSEKTHEGVRHGESFEQRSPPRRVDFKTNQREDEAISIPRVQRCLRLWSRANARLHIADSQKAEGVAIGKHDLCARGAQNQRAWQLMRREFESHGSGALLRLDVLDRLGEIAGAA